MARPQLLSPVPTSEQTTIRDDESSTVPDTRSIDPADTLAGGDDMDVVMQEDSGSGLSQTYEHIEGNRIGVKYAGPNGKIKTAYISFHPTVRVADNGNASFLPPNLCAFDLYEKVPKKSSEARNIIVAMYKREAMWIKFESEKPVKISIFAGGVNVVSGEYDYETQEALACRKKLMRHGHINQDYIIAPDQKWLDGMAVHDGYVAQFVAVPLIGGATVEAQMSDVGLSGGLQFELDLFAVYDYRIDTFKCMIEKASGGYPMGTGLGGLIRQTIIADSHPSHIWDISATQTINVDILGPTSFSRNTNLPVPKTPITSETYRKHRLPYYQAFNEGFSGFYGSFGGIKSVRDLDGIGAASLEKTKAWEEGGVADVVALDQIKRDSERWRCTEIEPQVEGAEKETGDDEEDDGRVESWIQEPMNYDGPWDVDEELVDADDPFEEWCREMKNNARF